MQIHRNSMVHRQMKMMRSLVELSQGKPFDMKSIPFLVDKRAIITVAQIRSNIFKIFYRYMGVYFGVFAVFFILGKSHHFACIWIDVPFDTISCVVWLWVCVAWVLEWILAIWFLLQIVWNWDYERRACSLFNFHFFQSTPKTNVEQDDANESITRPFECIE